MGNANRPENFEPSLRLPPALDDPGILVAWSLEHKHAKQPFGFGFGNREQTPQQGFLDPILFDADGHLITIAPTGAGKGTGCVIPTLLRYPGPVIVVDPKGENVAVTARRRREMGHRVIVLDPMDITEFESDALNPLDLLNIDQLGVVDEATTIAHTLLASELRDTKDRFWVNRGMQVIIGTMLYLMLERENEKLTLSSVREFINKSPIDLRDIAEEIRHSADPDLRQAAGAFGIDAPDTMGGVLAFAQEGLDFVRGQQIREATHESTFQLDDVTRGEPLSIYIVIPPEKLESHSRLLRLWINALMGAITRRRGPPPEPTLFLLDEAAQLGPLPQLRQAITLLRGYGLRTWSFWQDISQIKTLYPTDWPTMVNNCRVLQSFGATNLPASTATADLTGFYNPYTILDLDINEMILQIAGDEAVIAQKPNYLTDPCFEGMYDQNPLHDPERDIVPTPRRRQRHYKRPEPKPEPKTDTSVFGEPSLEPDILDKLLEKWNRE